MKKHIPNLFTLFNLLMGCLAIVAAIQGNLYAVIVLVLLGAVADFFDGFVARALGVSGELGKQLDSLADMVTFGVVPGLVMVVLLANTLVDSSEFLGLGQVFESSGGFNINSEVKDSVGGVFSAFGFYVGGLIIHYWWVFLGFSITLFSALRLAKFNIDTRQTLGFIGLPTPACTLFVISLIPLFTANNYLGASYIQPIVSSVPFLLITTFVLSYLLVAEIPMFALKFKNYGWLGNEVKFIFIILSVILLLSLQFLGLALSIMLYVGVSVLVGE